MERLTEFDSVWKDWKIIDPVENNQYVPAKLAEFEDFMEEHKINDLKELENMLCDLMTFEREKISYQIENDELQAYKKAWKELKRYILMFVNMPTDKVLDKMQELEPETEEKNGKK